MNESSAKCIKTLGPFGNVCEEAGTGGGKTLGFISNIFSRVIGVLTVAAGLWFFLQFLIAGFSWLSSGGDAQKISEAQSRMINAIIGLIIVVAAVAIMKVIEFFFGINFLNLPGFENQLLPSGE